MNYDPAAVIRVGLRAQIKLLNVLLAEEGHYPSFQLARSLAWDDLDSIGPGPGGFEDDLPQRSLDIAVVTENRVEVQGEQCNRLRSRGGIGTFVCHAAAQHRRSGRQRGVMIGTGTEVMAVIRAVGEAASAHAASRPRAAGPSGVAVLVRHGRTASVMGRALLTVLSRDG
jgi:hypothetical protein